MPRAPTPAGRNKKEFAIHEVTISLDDFGWSRLTAEAETQGVSPEELVVHATIYYLSDVDSGRIGRKPLPDHELEAPGPEVPRGER